MFRLMGETLLICQENDLKAYENIPEVATG